MLKRIVVRVIRVGLTLFGLLVAATLLAGYLAMSGPAFYVERTTAAATRAEQAAAQEQFEQSQAAIAAWLAASASRQQAQLAGSSPPVGIAGEVRVAAWQEPYDPTRDVYVFRATEQQLNSLLAGQEHSAGDSLQNVRVRLSEGGAELGAEIRADLGGAKSSSRTLVLSMVLQPTLTADGTLRLDIQSARVGRLPIPLRTILRCMPRPIVYSAHDADLDLNPESPHLALKLPRSDSATPTIKSIHCLRGEIVVELLPPVLKAPRNDVAASSLRAVRQ
jgi:hypothetical protein